MKRRMVDFPLGEALAGEERALVKGAESLTGVEELENPRGIGEKVKRDRSKDAPRRPTARFVEEECRVILAAINMLLADNMRATSPGGMVSDYFKIAQDVKRKCEHRIKEDGKKGA